MMSIVYSVQCNDSTLLAIEECHLYPEDVSRLPSW